MNISANDQPGSFRRISVNPFFAQDFAVSVYYIFVTQMRDADGWGPAEIDARPPASMKPVQAEKFETARTYAEGIAHGWNSERTPRIEITLNKTGKSRLWQAWYWDKPASERTEPGDDMPHLAVSVHQKRRADGWQPCEIDYPRRMEIPVEVLRIVNQALAQAIAQAELWDADADKTPGEITAQAVRTLAIDAGLVAI